ncbi:hypothetical protein Isop_0664 [Isosphaera pallida ATCC 43644]|uniref:Glycosyl transferase family 28 C-terminal domain-containing protein n=1 Tax=Isosphaera pallida (strain ATCC 43644 / DSM 9630 / IS1B) TaxID=575540 RepID=E8R0S1_ISOPI|nr:hypothetical protein [Isosphaera pallida]ADV61256.1 hypothetical protein Isop_0664 [Isosphaera pallida ATCC 43644]
MARRGGGGVAVFVTSHGFGHLNRVVPVLNAVPAEVPVTIATPGDLETAWRQRLTRPVEFWEHPSDAGAYNPPGDSLATDGPETLRRAFETDQRQRAQLPEWSARLIEAGIDAVLADAPALPLVAAANTGIAGFLLANFTWADIYRPHAQILGEPWIGFVERLAEDYRRATKTFRAQPGLTLKGQPRVESVGLVVNPARNRRQELRRRIAADPAEKLVSFYVGRYGQADLDWQRMSRLGLRGVRFVTFHVPDGVNIPNLAVVDPNEWTGSDLATSCDLVYAKAGYGTVAEAMAARTRLIYPPRSNFAEHPALDRALRTWGGGIRVSAREFLTFGPRAEEALLRALGQPDPPPPPPYPTNGAARVAAALVTHRE